MFPVLQLELSGLPLSAGDVSARCSSALSARAPRCRLWDVAEMIPCRLVCVLSAIPALTQHFAPTLFPKKLYMF